MIAAWVADMWRCAQVWKAYVPAVPTTARRTACTRNEVRPRIGTMPDAKAADPPCAKVTAPVQTTTTRSWITVNQIASWRPARSAISTM